jgi:hypothetical protein
MSDKGNCVLARCTQRSNDWPKHMIKCVVLLLVFPFCSALIAQDLKSLAAKEFKDENYVRAVSYLEKAVASNPDDAEAWYKLGESLHWFSYDSFPLPGFNQTASDRILICMQKALTLNAQLRDCYGLIGSEYGARAVHELQGGESFAFIHQLRLGREAGGYPDWLLEYARNTLNSCNRDAILFVGGDADVFPTWYCQFIDSIRTDVTVVPVTLLDRPWFLSILKSGLDKPIRPVAMPWTQEQIMDLHVSKWTPREAELFVPPEVQNRFGTTDSLLQWVLAPDLQRDNRTLLSINRIVTVGVLRANNWSRPVHFSLGCQPWMMLGLEDHMLIQAMTHELVPFLTKTQGRRVNMQASIRFLTNQDNFRRLVTLKNQDIPGVSGLLQNYRAIFIRTCDSLLSRGDYRAARQVIESMDRNIPESLLPIPDGWMSEIDERRARIKALER